MVLTDSLFSMDGDFADLCGLAELRRRYGFLLVRCAALCRAMPCRAVLCHVPVEFHRTWLPR